MLSVSVLLGILLMGVAILGGALATYHNVRNAKGPKERAFVIKICAISWIIIISLLLFVYGLPPPYRYVVLFLYFVGCPILIYKWATMHQLIRLLEQKELEDNPPR